MKIELCTPADFLQILADLTDFWGSDRTRHLHHPSLLHEFGNTAFVIYEATPEPPRVEDDGPSASATDAVSASSRHSKAENLVIAYLFGFFSQTKPTAYVHLAAVRTVHRGRGLGRHLYAHFAQVAQQAHCTSMKAITTPTNRASIDFHQALGFELEGDSMVDGVPIMRNYSGPGQDRVVLRRAISPIGSPLNREIKF